GAGVHRRPPGLAARHLRRRRADRAGGADLILIDDPLKPEEALSEARRNATNDWYANTLCSRLNDKRGGGIVIIMQRLHEDDLVGHVGALYLMLQNRIYRGEIVHKEQSHPGE